VFSADERFVAFAVLTRATNVRHEVMVWDLTTSKPKLLCSEIVNQGSGPGPSRVVAIAPDGKRVAALFADSNLRCWDVQGGQLLWQARAKDQGEALRGVRAVQILQAIGNSEARAILERLAQGLGSASLTRAAKESLARMTKR
jgi:hypothetical protein